MRENKELETIVYLSVTFIVEINKLFNYSTAGYEILKKIRRMRIFGAHIFSKSFGGKIQNF